MPSRSHRDSRREDDVWVRPYDPYRDVGNWASHPHVNSGQANYGFDEREQDGFYVDPYYNRPYTVSGSGSGYERPRRPRQSSSSYQSRSVPIPQSKRRMTGVYWALAILAVIAMLLLVALTVFLVLYVIDLENNNSSTTPTVNPTSLPVNVEVNIAMRMMQPYLPAYNDALSPEYMALENSFTSSMDDLFLSSDLRTSYLSTMVNSFSPGSVDVNATVFLNEAVIGLTPTPDPNDAGSSKGSVIGLEVANTIVAALEAGSCCLELAINASTVVVTQVELRTSPTVVPTNEPPTRPPPIEPLTTPMPDTVTQPDADMTTVQDVAMTTQPDVAMTTVADDVLTTQPDVAMTTVPDVAMTTQPDVAMTTLADDVLTTQLDVAMTTVQDVAMTTQPDVAMTTVADDVLTTQPDVAMTTVPDVAMTTQPDDVITTVQDVAMTTQPDVAMTTIEVQQPTTAISDTPDCGISLQPAPSTASSSMATRGTWPWIGSLRLRTGHGCGATLIEHRWAVTSASCLSGGGTFTSLVFGDLTSSYSQSDAHVELTIERVHLHPGFNALTQDNDIAFMLMAEPVVYSNDIGPVCLDQGSPAGVAGYSDCFIAGWSSLSGYLEEDLKSASVSSISEGACPGSAVALDLTDKFICAHFASADSCITDSGGGLMCRNSTTGTWSLVGIADAASDPSQCRETTFAKVSSYKDVATSIMDGDMTIPCDPIQVPQCTSALSYSSTFPTTQSAVADLMNSAETSGLLNCHSNVSTVLCASLMPECRSGAAGLTVCRQTCEDVSRSCAALLSHLQLTLECRIYPMGSSESAVLCESGEDSSCGTRDLSLAAVSDFLTLSSPNHPGQYPGYDDCSWVITGPQDSHLVLKFLKLGIESCCDTLTIGEGSDVTNRTSIKELVYASTLPSLITIPGPVVWLRFQSDSYEQDIGFKVEVMAVGSTGLASLCGEPMMFNCLDGATCIPYRWQCDGSFDCPFRDDESCQVISQEYTLAIDGFQQIISPGYATTGYQASASYTYIFTMAPGRRLLVNFEGFRSEVNYDVLYAGDGLDPESNRFFQWSGSTLPPTLLSDGNQMWFRFTSDHVIGDLGFDLYVYDVDGSVTFDCDGTQFDCGHTVCVPASWQCDGSLQCVDGSDETGCMQVMVSGLLTLLTPFTAELANRTTPEYQTLSQQFIGAMDTVLNSNLGPDYIYVATTVNNFKSSDDPTLRAVPMPDTVADYTIEMINRPTANPSNNVTRQIITDILINEVADGSLVGVSVNSSSVQIYQVLDNSMEATTAQPSLCPANEFECDAGRCIPMISVCDQVFDCADSTDEQVGVHCPVACGAQDISVPSQGSVRLTAPAVRPNAPQDFYKLCFYDLRAPAGLRIYITINSINLKPDSKRVLLNFFTGETLSITESNQNQTLDLISLTNRVHIYIEGYKWMEDSGVDFEIWTTNNTELNVCDNSFQVVPAERVCDQNLDCADYTDEINCYSSLCGQSNYTLDYNVSVPLQLTNYPTLYPDNTVCLWQITSPPNTSIIFYTNIVDLGDGDTVAIGLGHDHSAPGTTVAVVPGILSNGYHILVPGNQAYVLFLTDIEEVGTGFYMTMKALHNEDFIHCENRVQAVFDVDLCDGIAQCRGDPTDEMNCDACMNIPVANCSNLLPYGKTMYPSQYAANASDAVAKYQRARANLCQPQSELVLCSLLFPECQQDNNASRQAVCRSICEGAVSNCSFNEGVCSSLPDTGGNLWCNYDGDILETGICGTAPLANPVSRIVNGQDASLGEWPWMLAILDTDYKFVCGASLLNSQWAVTAAHCADFINIVLAGVNDLSNLGPHFQVGEVVETFVHPFYDPNNFVNMQHDIALMKLKTPLEINDYVRPTCINTEQNELEVYSNCYATGWGALAEGGSYPDMLQEVRLPLIAQQNCSDFLRNDFIINDNMICAGREEGGIDTCQGDSGGPLVCQDGGGRWVLVGATSFGLGCARQGKPGVYARISQYIEFIQYHIQSDLPAPKEVIGG